MRRAIARRSAIQSIQSAGSSLKRRLYAKVERALHTFDVIARCKPAVEYPYANAHRGTASIELV